MSSLSEPCHVTLYPARRPHKLRVLFVLIVFITFRDDTCHLVTEEVDPDDERAQDAHFHHQQAVVLVGQRIVTLLDLNGDDRVDTIG